MLSDLSKSIREASWMEKLAGNCSVLATDGLYPPMKTQSAFVTSVFSGRQSAANHVVD